MTPAQRDGHRIEPSRRTVGYALVALTAVALLVRIPRLIESLWYDEIAAWMDYGARGPLPILATYHDPANHVLHTLLTWCTVTLLPADTPEIALRLPALLFSLATIPAMYLLGRRAAGAAVGLWAAGLAAVAPVAVLEGADARGYALMIFFAALATERFLAVLDARRPRDVGLYALCCALGIWAHMMTLFVPIGHAAWLAVTVARRRRVGAGELAAAGAIGAGAVLTLICYAPILDDILRVRGMFRSASGPPLLGAEGLHLVLGLGGAWSAAAGAAGLLLAVAGGVLVARRPAARRAAVLALAGLPIAVVAVIASDGFLYARFVLFALPGTMLLMAVALEDARRRHVAVGGAAAAALAALFALDLIGRPPRQPLRQAVEHVLEHDPGAPVVAVGLRHRVLDAYRADLDLTHSLQHGVEDLDDRLAERDVRWLIVLYPDHVAPGTRRLIEEAGFTLDARLPGWIDWGAGTVLVYRAPPRSRQDQGRSNAVTSSP